MSDFANEYFRRTSRGTVSHASIDVSSSGDTTIASGVSGQIIIVYSIFLMAGSAVSVSWKSGSTTIIGACPIAANGGYHVETEFGVALTADGEDLIINLDSAVSVGGVVSYDFIDV